MKERLGSIYKRSKMNIYERDCIVREEETVSEWQKKKGRKSIIVMVGG